MLPRESTAIMWEHRKIERGFPSLANSKWKSGVTEKPIPGGGIPSFSVTGTICRAHTDLNTGFSYRIAAMDALQAHVDEGRRLAQNSGSLGCRLR
jgi:hypothetical protein